MQGLQTNFLQRSPPRGDVVLVGGSTRQLPTHGRLIRGVINLATPGCVGSENATVLTLLWSTAPPSL